MQQVIENGSGVVLKINRMVVGFATGMSFNRSTNSKVIYGIDSPIPQEIMPTTYSIQGTLTGLRLVNSGGLDGSGIMDVSNVSKFFNFKYATIEVVNRLTGNTIYTFQKVVFDNDSWSIQARSLITFSANFKAAFVLNEAAR